MIRHALGRTGQKRALVLRASWGSILGVQVARKAPELIHAYVGAGQVIDMKANEVVGYDSLMALLKSRGEAQAAEKLAAIGPPPYANFKVLKAERAILMAHPPASERDFFQRFLLAALFEPTARLKDIWDWRAGEAFSINQLYGELLAYSDLRAAPAIPVPVVIIQGDEDIQTPTTVARTWYDRLEAPSKTWVILPGGGHNAIFSMPEAFRAALRTHVRPLAQPQT